MHNKMKKLSGAAGFTLVELIVVIAILAILAGVAVPAYSGYIDKANRSADETMIQDIEQALIMGAYSANLESGSVLAVGVNHDADVHVSGKKSDGTSIEVEPMLDKTFGAGWKETLRLKWDGWADLTNGKVLAAIKEHPEYFKSVANSSFFSTDGATEDLAAKVDEIASAFKGILGDENGYKFANFWGTEFGNTVKTEDLNIKDSQTAANLTVMAAANAIANDTDSHADWIASWQDDNKEPAVNATDNGYVAPLVMNYAKYVSLVSYVNDPANGVDEDDVVNVNISYNNLVAAMNNLSNKSEDTSYIQAFNEAMDAFERAAVTGKSYYATWQSTKAKTDAEAFIATMATVNSLESTYVNKDKADELKQAEAFTKFGAAGILDTMVALAESGLSDEVVVQVKIAPNGAPEVISREG